MDTTNGEKPAAGFIRLPLLRRSRRIKRPLMRASDADRPSKVVKLQNRLNLGVDRDVSLRKPADLKGLAGGFAEVEEAADVVILVEDVKNLLGLVVRKAKRFDGHGFSISARRRQIFVDYVAQIHVEHVCFRDALERREQVARAVPCAER